MSPFPKASSRLLLFTVLLIDILAAAEIDLFIPSFPELRTLFHLSPFEVQFMISANFLAYCFCSLFSGALGDRYNRRTVMLMSLTILVVGGVLCVTAHNYPLLLIGRILQGIGIAGPAVLAFPIALEDCPIEKQSARMSVLNGVASLSLGFAPVIGSYIALFLGWRANFVALLISSLACLILGYFVLPNHIGNPGISLSPKAYWPLLCAKKMLLFILFFGLLASSYWVFIGMSPILYMQNLGVSLKEFGYYQGAQAGIFGIFCLLSPKIFNWFGERKSFYTGVILSIVSALLLLWLVICHTNNPLWITMTIMLMSIGAVFPVNIIFPQALLVVKNAQGRSAATLLSARLICTSLTLGVVSYFYDGTLFSMGLAVAMLILLSMLIIALLLKKGAIVLLS